MINDLKLSSPIGTCSWKFIDDVSSVEYLSKDSESHMQGHLDEVKAWSDNNLMKLNPEKCKEMQICFYKERPTFNNLTLGDHLLEIVSRHKVLGLVLQDNLKWNGHVAHTCPILSQAYRRKRLFTIGKIYFPFVTFY